MDDVRSVCFKDLPWEKLDGRQVVITGATGQIGSFLVDVLVNKIICDDLDTDIVILGRDGNKVRDRFYHWWPLGKIQFLTYVIGLPFQFADKIKKGAYFIHLASNTHPKQYRFHPISTVWTNLSGLKEILDLAVLLQGERVFYASSCEVYGNILNAMDAPFKEDYCGYIDCNTVRAGYPESKRCGEALCQAYLSETGLDFVTGRFGRIFGPTMNTDDSRAIGQFIWNGVRRQDIVLKSSGMQRYSFLHVADAVSALLTILLYGQKGDAYNIAFPTCDRSLMWMAMHIAKLSGVEVIKHEPTPEEAAAYSTATVATLDSDKLQYLQWSAAHDVLDDALADTIDVLRRREAFP